MNKSKLFLIILISIITIFLVTIYIMYRSDMRRMKKGEPIKYSNWGYAYSTLDKNGKIVIKEGEENSTLKKGQEYAIAIESGKDSEEYNRDEDLKKKREYEENMYSEDNIAKPSVEPYEIDEKELKEHNELKEKEQKVLNLLYEYYGQEEVEELYKNAENNSINDGKYVISEYSEELLDKILQLIEKEPINAEDKGMLVDMLGQIDLQTLNNTQIENRLQSIGIKVDK